MGVRLPVEYQEVEYIESTGTQYINVDSTHKEYEVVADFMPTVNAASSRILWGYSRYDDAYATAIFLTATSGGVSVRRRVSNSSNYYVWAGNRVNKRTKAELFKDHIAVMESDGTVIDEINQTVSLYSTAPMWLFHGASDGAYQSRYAVARLYRLTAYLSGIVAYDFIPCYRKSDSEPGMYDLVSGMFFTNAGTGEFVVGAEVHRTISPRLMDRRRALIAKLTSLFKRVITSQTGLVSFDTNVEKSMKVACEFSPVQDLHGYDYPWPAGGGKNLIPGFDNTTFWNTTGYIRSDGSITSSDNYRTSDYLAITPNSTYTYVSYNSGGGKLWRGVLAYDSEKSPIESSFQELQGANLIFTTPENAAYLRLYSMIGEGFYAQLELGSTATAYEPYENICPISGWTGANIEQRGKNYFNDEIINGSFNADGSHNAATNRLRSRNGIVLTAGNYTIDNNEGLDVAVWVFTTEGSYVSGESFIAWHSSQYQFTLTNTRLVRFCWRRSNNSDLTLSDISGINLYDRNTTLHLNWQTEAGIVYGGTITINPDGSADVVKTHSKRTLSTLTWTVNTSVANTYNSSIGDRARSVYEWGIKVISDRYKQYSSMGLGPPAYGFALGFSGDMNNANIYVKDSSTTSLSDFVDMITETGTYVVYPLATPQTYHFSNLEQLQSFLGINNVWHDMNGPITVEYYKKQQ